MAASARAGEGDPTIAPRRSRLFLFHRHGREFLDRTLGELSAAAHSALQAEQWSRHPGLLQRLDPRVKVLALLGFVLLVAFLHRPGPLFMLASLATVLAAFSRLPVRRFLARTWLPVPLSVAAVSLPAALSVVTPGPALFVISSAPPLIVTRPGLALAALLALRTGVALSFVVLLVMTTPWNELAAGLRALSAPRAFLTPLVLSWRYVALLMRSAAEMFVARRSRAVGRAHRSLERRFLGGAAGALLGRSLVLADEVHHAMVARGWTGEARSLRHLRLRARDIVWVGAMALAGILAAGWGLLG